jgi:FdhD protein
MKLQDRCLYPILTYEQGTVREKSDLVVAEYELAVLLNGELFISLLCTPRSLRELTAGFLFGEGIIAGAGGIGSLTVDPEAGIAEVSLEEFQSPAMPGGLAEADRILTSAGGQGGKSLGAGGSGLAPPAISKTLPLDPERVSSLMARFSERSGLFLATGGVHSCALSDGREILLFEDDIGRHNALDKIIGHTLLRPIAPEEVMVLTSGRVSTEIVSKVARRGIGVIVSRSAPTSRAIELALSLGMTLIGFARGEKFNVYANFGCLKGRDGIKGA